MLSSAASLFDRCVQWLTDLDLVGFMLLGIIVCLCTCLYIDIYCEIKEDTDG